MVKKSVVTVVNKLTGEVLELSVSTPVEIKDAWLMLGETMKALERAKDKLKPLVSELVESNQADFGDYIFKIIPIQRMTYDKSMLRHVLDEDTFDLMMIPDKAAVDRYLKENLDQLGEDSTKLRTSMVPTGAPYTTIRLEKQKRD